MTLLLAIVITGWLVIFWMVLDRIAVALEEKK